MALVEQLVKSLSVDVLVCCESEPCNLKMVEPKSEPVVSSEDVFLVRAMKWKSTEPEHEKNTMVLEAVWSLIRFLRVPANVTNLNFGGTTTTCCNSWSGTLVTCSLVVTSSAFSSEISPSFFTFGLMVAEHKMLILLAGSDWYLLGAADEDTADRILAILSSKPSSISLSPSSRTTYLICERFRFWVCSIWSTSLPGVATRTLTPLRNRAFSDFFFSPPITFPATILWSQ
ncbi:hypothetical protein OGAPHI_004600 [Ogataea philodendri]|uniref:Uncharacterized protein n=1 Tax=Ogataea philodendri TaxID=1378263 RepID=A0A9P8T2W6_9ASCO|nr:uncharacterized protein OGAPHI_004600 [Ogataea philodendri]KAH3664248.1 hypothetical protein OGAPHI_004600 [Ogataea philodendri]